MRAKVGDTPRAAMKRQGTHRRNFSKTDVMIKILLDDLLGEHNARLVLGLQLSQRVLLGRVERRTAFMASFPRRWSFAHFSRKAARRQAKANRYTDYCCSAYSVPNTEGHAVGLWRMQR